MRAVTTATQNLLERREAVFRDLLWIGARRRTTGQVAERGWWSGMGTVSMQVIDAQDNIATRTYIGGGDLLSVDDIPLVIGLTAQSVTVRLSIASVAVDEAIREWDPRRARVEVHRAILDPDSMLQTQPAVRRFVGFVDQAEIQTPEQGGEGAMVLTCASLSQELLRSNSAKRSDADQRLRDPNDRFFQHAGVIHKRKVTWVDEDKP